MDRVCKTHGGIKDVYQILVRNPEERRAKYG
jgi:hypothetical protein